MIEFLTLRGKPFEGLTLWKEALNNLLAKKKETSTKTVPALGIGIIASLCCLLVSPIVNVLYQNIDSPLWRLLAFVPYILIIGLALFCHYHDMKYKYSQDYSWGKFFTEIFYVYSGKVKEDTKYEVLVIKSLQVEVFANG